jgi:NUMOD1 domain-containing protein
MSATTSLSYVYDGRQCLGHVIGRGKLGFEAFDRDDKSLGVFPSIRDAANALSPVSS